MSKTNSRQRLAPAKSTFEVVPELDVWLVGFPAEKDFALIDNGWKIDEAARKVFDENLAPLEFSQNLLHVRERADPLIDRIATDIMPLIGHATQTLFKAL